jgi:hypothetical protein
MHTIKSVGVLSCAKIFGAVQAAIGLVFMPFFLLVGLAGVFASRGGNSLPAAGFVVIAVLLPILYGIIGFIMGALGAWVYNLVSNWFGGIELQLQPPAAAAIVTSTYSGMD